MTFLAHNIGYIIIALLGLVVLGRDYEPAERTEYDDFEESAWANSKENPNSPCYDS